MAIVESAKETLFIRIAPWIDLFIRIAPWIDLIVDTSVTLGV
jgi:hypothetical protein